MSSRSAWAMKQATASKKKSQGEKKGVRRGRGQKRKGKKGGGRNVSVDSASESFVRP